MLLSEAMAQGLCYPTLPTPPSGEPEKKYTDADVNNISKKNSEKAVNKLLEDLGITDVEKAKKILKDAVLAQFVSEKMFATRYKIEFFTNIFLAKFNENFMKKFAILLD